MILPRGGGGGVLKSCNGNWEMRLIMTVITSYPSLIFHITNDLCRVFNSVKNVIKRELKPVCMCVTDSIVITTQSECHKVLTPNSPRQSAPICWWPWPEQFLPFYHFQMPSSFSDKRHSKECSFIQSRRGDL